MSTLRSLSHKQLLLATAVLVVVGMAFANFTDVGGNDDAEGSFGAFAAVSLLAILLAAFLTLWLLPRVERDEEPSRPATAALLFGVPAFLSLVGFWTAVPFVLGVPAVHLGAIGLHRAGKEYVPDDDSPSDEPIEVPGRGQAIGGLLLGSLAVVLGLVACIIG